MGVIHRQSWVWAVLSEGARRVDSRGDPGLAEVLRETGYTVTETPEASETPPNGPVDAVLFDTDEAPAPEDLRRAASELAEGGVLSIAVAGGSVAPPRPVSALVRIGQLLVSPVATIRALIEARGVERSLRTAGLDSSRIATGDRSRSRYGLGRGGWLRRLRTPVGFVLTASRGPRPQSLLEAAISRAEESAGVSLERRSTTVFESGKVVLSLRASDGSERFMRLAAGPAQRPLNASLEAIHAVTAADPPAAVRDRMVVPEADGRVGPLRYSLEPNAEGFHPWRMTDELWEDCLGFLVALHELDVASPTIPAERTFGEQAERMHGYLDADERAALTPIVQALERRLEGVPRGQSHGDFWRENLLVRGGRLATVLDWEWAARGALPMLDLFDLIALSRRRLRDFTPGERFTDVLWPLARAGGDERVIGYCRALDLPTDAGTLEALAVAYWLNRVARGLAPLSMFPQREGWRERNLHDPLRRLVAAGC
jgi:hypothetical protein